MRQKCTTKMYSGIMIWPQTIIYHSYISYEFIYIHICISKKGNLGQIKCPNNTYICILLAAVPTKSIKLLGSLHASFHKILILLTFSFAWASCIREHTKSWVLSYQGKYVHQENCHKANRPVGRYRHRCNQERLKYIGGDTSTQSISHPISNRLQCSRLWCQPKIYII